MVQVCYPVADCPSFVVSLMVRVAVRKVLCAGWLPINAGHLIGKDASMRLFAPKALPSQAVNAEMMSRLLLSGGLIGAGLLAAVQPLHAEPTTINDARGPVVTILQPQYNDTLKGSVSVLIGVKQRKFTPQTVEMFVDSKSETNGPVMLSSLPSANFSWDTTRHPDGPHKLTVVVTDTQGFRGSAEVTIFINNNRQRDLTPPSLNWIGHKNGDVWRGKVNIQLKVVDDFGGQVFVRLPQSRRRAAKKSRPSFPGCSTARPTTFRSIPPKRPTGCTRCALWLTIRWKTKAPRPRCKSASPTIPLIRRFHRLPPHAPK
jgi:hypothetical protein